MLVSRPVESFMEQEVYKQGLPEVAIYVLGTYPRNRKYAVLLNKLGKLRSKQPEEGKQSPTWLFPS